MFGKIQTVRPTLLRVCDSVKLDNGVTIPCLAGQCGDVDIISTNGYRYKKGFWDNIINSPQVQSMIKSKDSLGCIEHPVDDNEYLKTPYSIASHIVLKTWVS